MESGACNQRCSSCSMERQHTSLLKFASLSVSLLRRPFPKGGSPGVERRISRPSSRTAHARRGTHSPDMPRGGSMRHVHSLTFCRPVRSSIHLSLSSDQHLVYLYGKKLKRLCIPERRTHYATTTTIMETQTMVWLFGSKLKSGPTLGASHCLIGGSHCVVLHS